MMMIEFWSLGLWVDFMWGGALGDLCIVDVFEMCCAVSAGC